MNQSFSRLENPDRVAELNPMKSLERIGLKSGEVICDIGAGTGIFTFAAAKITKAAIYAVDISEDMLHILYTKANEQKLNNIVIKNNTESIPAGACNVVFLCTVFHELSDIEYMMGEIKRILSFSGTLAVIEFHKRTTPMGPPVEHRIDCDTLNTILHKFGFNLKKSFNLGENFYCSVFHIN